MNKQGVLEYLGKVDDDVDLVIMPRRVLNLVEHKDIGMSASVVLQQLTGIDLVGRSCKRHPCDKFDFRRCAQLLLEKIFPSETQRREFRRKVWENPPVARPMEGICQEQKPLPNRQDNVWGRRSRY